MTKRIYLTTTTDLILIEPPVGKARGRKGLCDGGAIGKLNQPIAEPAANVNLHHRVGEAYAEGVTLVQSHPVAPAKGKVPLQFIRSLKSVGIQIEESMKGFYLAHPEINATSIAWQAAAVYFLSDLIGVQVGTGYLKFSYPEDPLHWTPLDPGTESGGFGHVAELWRLIANKARGEPGSPLQTFSDASVSIPALVQELMDPPATCPLAHGAPDGAYLISLKLFFFNFWMSIRIHRRRPSVHH